MTMKASGHTLTAGELRSEVGSDRFTPVYVEDVYGNSCVVREVRDEGTRVVLVVDELHDEADVAIFELAAKFLRKELTGPQLRTELKEWIDVE